MAAVPVLLVGFPSAGVEAVTDAELLTLPAAVPAATAATTVMVNELLAGSDVAVQETVAKAHVAPTAVIDVAANPAGSVSATTTSVAFDGPLLVATIVNVADWPAITGPAAVFVTEMSASPVELVCTDAVAGFEAWGDVAVAVLVNEPVEPAGTAATMTSA